MTIPTHQVYFYTQGLPLPGGSGAQMRIYTNLRAYCDLAYPVEVVYLGREPVPRPAGMDLLVQWTALSLTAHRPTVWQRLAYRLGFPFSAVLDTLYPTRRQVQLVVREREQRTPGALHHFEYEFTAAAALGLSGVRVIWSHHDDLLDRYAKLNMVRQAVGRGKEGRRYARRLEDLRRVEQALSRRSNLVLTIAAHETETLRARMGLDNIHLLPMSWPDEIPVLRTSPWAAEGKLRLLHLGSIDALVGFTSLRFLLAEVFPRLSPDTLARLELWVAGKAGDTEYTRQIRALAAPYPQVRFLGFVADLRSLYAQADVQVVGSDSATGLRTRIIESFVYGVPVLSTAEAAAGVLGLAHAENIFLAADPAAFARQLEDLAAHPQKLPAVALAARQTYDQHYSRARSAAVLNQLLSTYAPFSP